MDSQLNRSHAPRLRTFEPSQLAAAYKECETLAHSHYENFPVASKLLPKHLRPAVAVIYTFARRADDIADEGQLASTDRLTKLAQYRTELRALEQGQISHTPLFIALADVISRHALPIQLFHDLLTAFEHDVNVQRYADQEEVLSYCSYSANPVGRLMLHLFRQVTPINLEQSDAICTALQLINFLQDMSQDYHEMGRIYLPESLLRRFGVEERHFRDRITDDGMRQCFAVAVAQARALMIQGAPLAWSIKGRLGWELRFIVSGGLRILSSLATLRDDVFSRPRLELADWLKIGLIALRMSPPRE